MKTYKIKTIEFAMTHGYTSVTHGYKILTEADALEHALADMADVDHCVVEVSRNVYEIFRKRGEVRRGDKE